MPHWSRVGRLKRSSFPNLGGGGHTFGGGASAGVATSVAGRLVADTYLGARELLHEVDYTLATLARSHLGEARCELAAADVPGVPSHVQEPAVPPHAPMCNAPLAAQVELATWYYWKPSSRL